jgi:hypothetical protein
MIQYVQAHIKDIFAFQVQKTFPIENVSEAIKHYHEAIAGNGKTVITFD